MSDIIPLLTKENAKRVAEDILTAIEEKGNKDTIDVDFKLKNGVMERTPIHNQEILKTLVELHGREVPSPNTWFSFDTKLDSMLGFLKDTVCKKIDDNTITDTEFAKMQDFLKIVVNLINKDEDLLARLKAALRKNALNNGDEVIFPLNECMLVLFEFGAKEDYGDMIKVFNYRRVNKATGTFVGEKNAIAKDLLQRRRDFGYERGQNTQEIYTKIIEDQRAAGNFLYLEILPQDVEIVAEAQECHLDIFVDYSPIGKEELIAKTVEANGQEKSAEV